MTVSRFSVCAAACHVIGLPCWHHDFFPRLPRRAMPVPSTTDGVLTLVILGLGQFSVQSVIKNNPLDQDEY